MKRKKVYIDGGHGTETSEVALAQLNQDFGFKPPHGFLPQIKQRLFTASVPFLQEVPFQQVVSPLHGGMLVTGSCDILSLNYDSYLESTLRDSAYYLTLFSHLRGKKVAALRTELIALYGQLKQHRDIYIAYLIYSVISKISQLTRVYLNIAICKIKARVRGIFELYSRNLRFCYRNIIGFFFKNMDDEAHSEFAFYPQKTNIYFTVKKFRSWTHHQILRPSLYWTGQLTRKEN